VRFLRPQSATPRAHQQAHQTTEGIHRCPARGARRRRLQTFLYRSSPSACANRKAARLLAEIRRADTAHPIVRGVLEASRCEGVWPRPPSDRTSPSHPRAVLRTAAQRGANHPSGCRRPRVPDGAVFEEPVRVLVFGCAYRRIAGEKRSPTTLGGRRDERIEAGATDGLRGVALESCDRFPGPESTDPAAHRRATEAPCQGTLRRRDGGWEPGGSRQRRHQALDGRGGLRRPPRDRHRPG
jgi:hypothetical protein